jgi:hypothetical protein
VSKSQPFPEYAYYNLVFLSRSNLRHTLDLYPYFSENCYPLKNVKTQLDLPQSRNRLVQPTFNPNRLSTYLYSVGREILQFFTLIVDKFINWTFLSELNNI